jgi:hypothetical protein
MPRTMATVMKKPVLVFCLSLLAGTAAAGLAVDASAGFLPLSGNLTPALPPAAVS